MFKGKRMYVINTVIAAICSTVLALVDIYGYKGLGSKIPFILLAPWLATNVCFLFRKKTDRERFLFPVGLLIVVASIAIFVFGLPAVSYPEAKNIAMGAGLTDLTKSPLNRTLATELPTKRSLSNPASSNAYMFTGELEGEKVYLLVSPWDGSIQTETVGDSYIDGAIESLEERDKGNP